MSKEAKLMNVCKEFIEKNGITCVETIYQCDWVSENSLEFIEKICKIVGYKKGDDEP